jgi:hypothetical protein
MYYHISHVNFWAVLVATIASFMLGGWWYSMSGFGRAWLAAIGKSMNDLGSPAVAMTLTFISTFITAIILAMLINALGDPTLFRGARLGFILGVGIVATSMFSDYVFSGNPLELFLIQSGYRVVLLTIMGGIIGVWG